MSSTSAPTSTCCSSTTRMARWWTPGVWRAIGNGLFYDRLAEGLIQTLTEVTPEGFLYRVDMRLRPEGELGPLTRSLRSYWIYYESRGQLWERQMLIKARLAAGSSRLWHRFRDNAGPLRVPGPHFAVSPQQRTIRRVKERIEAEVRHRPEGRETTSSCSRGAFATSNSSFSACSCSTAAGPSGPGPQALCRPSSGSAAGRSPDAGRGEGPSGGLPLPAAPGEPAADRLRPSDLTLFPRTVSVQAEALRDRLDLGPGSLSAAVASHLSAVRARSYESVFGSDRQPAPEAGAEDPRWLLDAPARSEGVGRTLKAAGFRETGTAHPAPAATWRQPDADLVGASQPWRICSVPSCRSWRPHPTRTAPSSGSWGSSTPTGRPAPSTEWPSPTRGFCPCW